MMSVGAMTSYASRYLVDDDPNDDVQSESIDDLMEQLGEIDELIDGQVDLDEFMISAAHARMTQDTTPEHLSKIW